MGFWKRIEKAVHGFGDVATAPVGIIKDLALAPFKSGQQFDGSIPHVVAATLRARGAQTIEGVGEVAQLGAPAASAAGRLASPVLDGMNTAYREGVAEPLSTMAYVMSKVAPGQGYDNYFKPEVYREGYRRAQFTSPGQAITLDNKVGFFDTVKDDSATSTAEGVQQEFSKWGLEKALSGGIDAGVRWFLDPTIIGGKLGRAAYVAKFAKGITAGTDLERVTGASRFRRFNTSMEGKDAARIRDEYFPELPNGGALSVTLAEAPDAAARADVLRLAMGDRSRLTALYERKAALGNQAERLLGEQSILKSLDADNFARVNSPDALQAAREIADAAPPSAIHDLTSLDGAGQPGMLGAEGETLFDALPGKGAVTPGSPQLAKIQAELNDVYDAERRAQRMESFVGSITTEPGRGALIDRNALRSSLTHSEFYQKSRSGAILRTTFNMRPPRMIDLNNPAGDIHIQRALKKSTLSPEKQDEFRTAYMREITPEGRAAVLTKAEDEAITKLAADHGLTTEQMQPLLANAAKGRQQARDILKNRVYDGEGRSLVRHLDDADGVLHEYPLLVSQTADVLPMADLDAARRALRPLARYRAQHPTLSVPPAVMGDLLGGFMRVWKPSVLLRVGWPIRVVGDEQLRIMAKVGVLAQMKNLGPGVAHLAAKLPGAERVGLERTGIGFGTTDAAGYQIEGAFGADRSAPNAFFDLSSSRASFDKAVGHQEAAELERLRKVTAGYSSLDPVKNADSYGKGWLAAVNNQMGNDPLARVYLAGGSTDDGLAFLRSQEGRAHAARLPLRRTDLEGWAQAVHDQVETYTMGSDVIKQAALGRKAKLDDLFAHAPDPASRPQIHGEILADAMGKGPASTAVGNVVQSLYKNLGSVPSDTLSRHPFFDHMYRAEAKRLAGLLDSQGGKLTPAELKLVERKSREHALQQTKHLLYDLADESDLSHLLRFVMPFYSAWQETLTRWGGLAVEEPAFIARLNQVWQSPERAGVVTDEDGNSVYPGDKSGQQVRYDDGTFGTIGKQRYVTLPIPNDLLAGFGVKGLKTQANVRLNKRAFNTILQIAPGFGPPVQVPVNEVVKERPDLANSVKFVLPFGAQQNSLGALLPATARRLESRMAGDEDRTFFNSTMRIYTDSVIDYKLGKRDTKPTYAEAVNKAKAFYSLRTVASFVSPAAPGFTSPYQPYIDAYRRMKTADPVNADQQFLDQFGEEYFAITQSFSKSADGVVPTVEAFDARKKYLDLIQKHPDLGGLIIGSEGAGEFSNSVYQSQLSTKVSPGSTENERNPLPFEEIAAGPNVKLGWMQYQKMNDLIDAERIRRGLPNLRVKGAKDLATAKTALTAALAAKYPEWSDAFAKQDRNAMERRLTGLREIAKDPRLAKRPDIQGVSRYLQARDAFHEALKQRDKAKNGSATLDTPSNTDLAVAWETVVGQLTEGNLAFSALYYRYLDRDNLEAE